MSWGLMRVMSHGGTADPSLGIKSEHATPNSTVRAHAAMHGAWCDPNPARKRTRVGRETCTDGKGRRARWEDEVALGEVVGTGVHQARPAHDLALRRGDAVEVGARWAGEE